MNPWKGILLNSSHEHCVIRVATELKTTFEIPTSQERS